MIFLILYVTSAALAAMGYGAAALLLAILAGAMLLTPGGVRR